MRKYLVGLLFLFTVLISQSFDYGSDKDDLLVVTSQNSCDANSCLDETCRSFISRCRKGGIHSEFPGQFYDVKIRVVKEGKTDAHKKAWKLLNDGRFKK